MALRGQYSKWWFHDAVGLATQIVPVDRFLFLVIITVTQIIVPCFTSTPNGSTGGSIPVPGWAGRLCQWPRGVTSRPLYF